LDFTNFDLVAVEGSGHVTNVAWGADRSLQLAAGFDQYGFPVAMRGFVVTDAVTDAFPRILWMPFIT